jgi:two-component system capsular synthesis response regulator RcsB
MNIVIADDHPVVRIGLRVQLHALKNARIVGEAECAKSTIDALARAQCDVAILDYSMPSRSTCDGAELIREVLRRYPGVRVVSYLCSASSASTKDALDAGATAAIPRTAPPATLIAAVSRAFCSSRALRQERQQDVQRNAMEQSLALE